MPERIATFDNAGTLWVEQPMYTQLALALDHLKALAPTHPEWKEQQPFKAAQEGDPLAKAREKAAVELILVAHAGMPTADFAAIVMDWLRMARHPRFDRPYTEFVYQPMLELHAYLRGNGFKTFIVSGGDIEFMRPWTERIYGVPPEQVVGSSIKTRFQISDGYPLLLRLPNINFVDDGAGKPVGINEHIGRRPIAAFGNSDADLQTLQWTTLAGEWRRWGLLVHHTDAEREYTYDRRSHLGRLDVALDLAAENNWIVVDMKTIGIKSSLPLGRVLADGRSSEKATASLIWAGQLQAPPLSAHTRSAALEPPRALLFVRDQKRCRRQLPGAASSRLAPDPQMRAASMAKYGHADPADATGGHADDCSRSS